MKVLIAEDDVVTCKLLQRLLSNLGYSCEFVSDGHEAWERLQEKRIGVLLLDWQLPGINGSELCKRLRDSQTDRYTYIVAMTTHDEHECRRSAMESGADDSLHKPVVAEDLALRIAVARRIMGMQHHLEAQFDSLVTSQSMLEESNEVLTQQREQVAELLMKAERSKKIAEVSNRRFEQLFSGLPVAGFTCDQVGTVFEWNTRAEIMFTITADKAIYQPLQKLLGKRLVTNAAMDQIRSVFAGNTFSDFEWKADGRVFLVSGQPLLGTNGEVNGCLATAVDISEQRKAQAQLKRQNVKLKEAKRAVEVMNKRLAEMAVTDALTRIPNHRALIDRLRMALHDAERGQRMSLSMVDVDFFKKFNDEFGHQAGDEVLIAVADTLRRSIRKSDFVARYGGEEFCVLFANADEATALKLADRLRRKISEIVTPYRKITASFGLAEHPGLPISGEELIKAADEALYDAKHAGRNTVACRKVQVERAA